MKKNKKDRIIKASKHSFKFSNFGKLENLKEFIDEYTIATKIYVEYIWNNDITWYSTQKLKDNQTKITEHFFSIAKEQYDCPSMLDYKNVSFPTALSARAQSSAITQACGIVRSHTEMLVKMNNKLEWLIQTKKTENRIENYKQRIQKKKSVESINLNIINPELSTKNCEFITDDRHFNGWIHLKSIGKQFGNIYIPVNFHKFSNKLKETYDMMTSFLISPDHVDIRWEKYVPKKSEGLIVGADPGVNRICSFSHIDNPDNSEYKDCLYKIARKKKNSNAYKKSIKERTNIVNKTLNKLDLSSIKQINLEDNSTVHYKNYSGQFLSHYAYGEIKTKIENIALEHGVRVPKQGNVYKSQRCSACGWTQKSNRNKTIFKCKKCSIEIDSDFNSSINQTCKLMHIPVGMCNQKLNREGFFWNSEGLFSQEGQEFRVPDLSLHEETKKNVIK